MTFIMVAPNGARKTAQDHPAVPVTDSELVETAVTCFAQVRVASTRIFVQPNILIYWMYNATTLDRNLANRTGPRGTSHI